MAEDPRFLVQTIRRRTSTDNKLALQTAIVHLCCSVACIIIGVFSLAIIKSPTIERVYGLPLWIGLLLLTTGFAGIQCHVKKTKLYAVIYLAFSFLAMFFNLIAIAWMLGVMNGSEATVISLVCVSTFDMGISCLSTAFGCNILFADCKMCKHRRRSRASRIPPSDRSPTTTQLGADVSVSSNQDGRSRGMQEVVHLTSGQARYIRQYPPRPGDEPPSYSEAVGPPPPYTQN